MAIRITGPKGPKDPKAPEKSLVVSWDYGTCGGLDGVFWVRMADGAIRIWSGEVAIYSTKDLKEFENAAFKDPDLSLELIFTKGK